MAMKNTIKKILKEEKGEGFTKFELYVLNWMFDELEGRLLSSLIHSNLWKYGKFLSKLKDIFGLTHKMLAEIIYLYDNNLTGTKFIQKNDVIRKEAIKWNVSYFRDVNAWLRDDWVVYAVDENSAYNMADAADITAEDNLGVVSRGEVVVGDAGDVYDSEAFEMRESIKKQLNLLKESINDKISDKLLINICKDIENWLDGRGSDWDDFFYVYSGGEEYHELKEHLNNTYSLPSDTIHYVIAVYGENYERINRDWGELLETGIIKPKKTKWEGRKEFGATQWIHQTAGEEAYSEAELNYYDYDGDIDWEDDYYNTHDTWDEETEWKRYG